MQNLADSRIIGDQSILHFPVGVSGSKNILESHELVNELFSKVDKKAFIQVTVPKRVIGPDQRKVNALWRMKTRNICHINSVPIKAT